MANAELIGLLCAGSVRYHRSGSGGRPVLSRSELAGLLAGLSGPQMDFALARYGCDEQSERKLIAHVRVWLSDFAVRESWKIVRGRPTVCNMAALAVMEAVRPNRCERCQGRGVLVNRVCGRCSGSGYRNLSGRDVAEAIGVDQSNYCRTWRPRYESAFHYVQGFDSEVNSVLRRADKNPELSAL